MTLLIGHRAIGPDAPPYIIAEIGVNHDGSIDRALQLIDAAADAGVDAVKTQLFDADLLLSRASDLTSAQRAAGETEARAMLSRLQLTREELMRFVDHAHRRGVQAIVSIFSLDLIEPARDMGWDALKSASPDIIHHPLLAAMQTLGKPLIISTGAADRREIADAARRYGDAFLHCVSAYPTPLPQARLRGIGELRSIIETAAAERGRAAVVGYSDHTAETETGGLAVAAGALILEKHFTLRRDGAGPDHAASLEPADLAAYVRGARAAWEGLGRCGLGPQGIESDVRRLSRQSVVTTRLLARGHRLTASDLTIKRPGSGLPPSWLPHLPGSVLARTVEADWPLREADLTADSLNDVHAAIEPGGASRETAAKLLPEANAAVA